jgi:hypothetical protein
MGPEYCCWLPPTVPEGLCVADISIDIQLKPEELSRFPQRPVPVDEGGARPLRKFFNL